MSETVEEIGTIKDGEYHPAANSALAYVKTQLTPLTIEAFASTALSGNRMAEICYSTIKRLNEGAPVSDRYILGLAWYLKEMESHEALPSVGGSDE